MGKQVLMDKEIGAALAVIYKIQTLADGGARITLDFDSSSSNLVQKLLVNKLVGSELVSVGFVETQQ